VSGLADLPIALTAMASSASRLAWDRLAPGTARVPLRPEELTPTWFSEALAAVSGGASVARVRVLGENAGTTHRLRVGLDYTVDAPAAPRQVFCKLSPTDTKTRMFVTIMGLGEREVSFYRHVRPHVPVRTPAVYAALCDEKRARFCLLLEDVEGADFVDVTDPCTPGRAEAVMKALGRLHGAFWESHRFGKDWPWINSSDDDPNAAVGRLLVERSRRMVLEKFGDLIPLAVRGDSEILIGRRAQVESAWARGPLTLLHGDPHIGNLYFVADDVGFLDWQVMRRGNSMRDVTYFLILSLPTEVRRQHETDLLRSYTTSLSASGGPTLAFDHVWTQYRRLAPYPWIAAVVTTAAGGLQAADIARTGLIRSTAALEDLDAFAAVEEMLAG